MIGPSGDGHLVLIIRFDCAALKRLSVRSSQRPVEVTNWSDWCDPHWTHPHHPPHTEWRDAADKRWNIHFSCVPAQCYLPFYGYRWRASQSDAPFSTRIFLKDSSRLLKRCIKEPKEPCHHKGQTVGGSYSIQNELDLAASRLLQRAEWAEPTSFLETFSKHEAEVRTCPVAGILTLREKSVLFCHPLRPLPPFFPFHPRVARPPRKRQGVRSVQADAGISKMDFNKWIIFFFHLKKESNGDVFYNPC